jgi:hypothetical protein
LQGFSSHGSSDSAHDSSNGWQPPQYRRAGIRLRNKRALQAAERSQRTGQALVVEELHQVLHGGGGGGGCTAGEDSSSTPGGAGAGGSSGGSSSPVSSDAALEAFIERMLSPQASMWQQRQQAQGGAASVDGREALDAGLMANLHAAPLADIRAHQLQLARRGQLQASLLLMEAAAGAGRGDVLAETPQKGFMRAAGAARNSGAVLRFLQLLPAEHARAATYNMALKACAEAADLRAALRVVDIMGIRQVPTDFMHFTTLITGACVCVWGGGGVSAGRVAAAVGGASCTRLSCACGGRV